MKNTSTQKQQKTKQFSARTTHSRSASIGRNLNKLGRITSYEDVTSHHQGPPPHGNPSAQAQAQAQRPLLNRSRSTESTLARRNNRSFTKLTSLHPLARTRSHQHVPRIASKVVIDLHRNNESSDDDGEEKEEEEEEEVDAFSDDGIDVETEETVPDKVPSPQLQPLSYRAPPQFSHRNATPTSQESTPKKPLTDSDQLAKATANMLLSGSAHETQLDDSLATLTTATTATITNGTQQHQTHHHHHHNNNNQEVIDAQKEPSQQELAQYYQNMILSQSTGLVRQFSDLAPFNNSLLPDGIAQLKQQEQQNLQYIHSNDHISGTIPNGKSMSESHNSLKQFTINQMGQSHDSSSALSFKADPVARRDQLKMTSLTSVPSAASQQRDSPLGTPNFSQFIRSGPSNIETRAQQKLWLQRENSLFDLSILKNTNVVTPQVRREFEKVSREFMNVRRFLNPINDAVKRANVSKGSRKKSNETNTPTPEKIQAFKNDEVQAILMKLWIQGDHHTPSLQTRPQPQRPQSPHNLGAQNQQARPTIQQHQSAYSGLMSSNNNNSHALRAPMAPTTRAVDRANNSAENKRIDLAAMRHAEDQVQKLS